MTIETARVEYQAAWNVLQALQSELQSAIDASDFKLALNKAFEVREAHSLFIEKMLVVMELEDGDVDE